MQKEELVELWMAFVAGEEEAFSQLYQMLYPQLYRYGLRLTNGDAFVKDGIQDTFFYIYEKRTDLPTNIENVSAYLFTSFRRNLVRKLQQEELEEGRREEGATSIDQRFTISADTIILREEADHQNKELLASLLNELPPRQREILYLKYYQDQTMSEMAETLEISYQTVANQLYRALKKLRDNSQTRGIQYLYDASSD